jgi:hypothetical protein
VGKPGAQPSRGPEITASTAREESCDSELPYNLGTTTLALRGTNNLQGYAIRSAIRGGVSY